MFNQGFVFGKFYPLHNGHLALIRFAAEQCKKLIVLVCASNKERITAATRLDWLEEELSELNNVEVMAYFYDEAKLPNTSVANKEVSALWSKAFLSYLPKVDLVVTSEPYGVYLSKYMGIKHITYDVKRSDVPISASEIRKNILGKWQYLPTSVKRYFQKVLVINGTESTGKTRLSQYLAKHYPCSLVKEAGRALVPNSNRIQLNDLQKVASSHARAIKKARETLRPLVVVDTDVYITQSYAQFSLGQTLELDRGIYEANRADLRLYLDSNIEFVQDGTRMNKADRDLLDESHRDTLDEFNQPFVEISGLGWRSRTRSAHEAVNDMLQVQWY